MLNSNVGVRLCYIDDMVSTIVMDYSHYLMILILIQS